MTFPENILALFAAEVAKYPTGRKQSAVMACLAIVQNNYGHLDTASEEAVARYLDMPPMAVREVSSFYNMYNTQAVGSYKLNVCTNLPCQLRGGETTLNDLCSRLKVAVGETTADGVFTVQPSECLGACADAPVLLVNDRHMCSFMDAAKVHQLVDALSASTNIRPSA